ncbi:MAG TPA: DUF4388 domain-containing protein [Planctomycetota bacterium]|nr:DUF4388 domain-containing protein [Planctomycetota bacterium]
MGTIRGDLSVLGIANLLQSLALGKCEGLLTFELGAHQKALRLHPDGLRLVRGSRRCHRLEQLLRRVGPVASSSELPGGAPSLESIGRLVREWMLEEVCDLFTWTRGTFRFQEGADLPKTASALDAFDADADVTSVILESARRIDDLPRLRHAFPDPDAIPVRTAVAEPAAESALDAEIQRDVLPLVDGTRSVNQIVRASAYPRLSVLQALSRLARKGALAVPVPRGSVARQEFVAVQEGPVGVLEPVLPAHSEEGGQSRALGR